MTQHSAFSSVANFDSLLWGDSGDHSFMISNYTSLPSSSKDCGLIFNFDNTTTICDDILFDIVTRDCSSFLNDWYPREVE